MADKKVTSKRVPVLVNNEQKDGEEGSTYARLKAYSDLTGIPVTHIVNEALDDWLATVGAARAEALKKLSAQPLPSNLLVMPAPQATEVTVVS